MDEEVNVSQENQANLEQIIKQQSSYIQSLELTIKVLCNLVNRG